MPAPKPIATYGAFPIEGGASGKVSVTEDEVHVEVGGRTKRLRRPSIENVEKEGEMALNKVGVAINYFDMLGDRTVERFAMRENEFRALKATLGK